MSYTPPLGSAVYFSGRSGYFPPYGDSVDFSAMPRFDIDVRTGTTFLGVGNAISVFELNVGSLFSPETKERDVVISCGSASEFVTNQRHVVISSASLFSPLGVCSFPSIAAISEGSTTSFEGVTFNTGAFAEYCSSNMTMQGVAETRRNMRIRTKSDFLLLASFNKQMSFSIYGRSRFSPKSSFNAPRSLSIEAYSETRFKGISESQASFHTGSESDCWFVGRCTHSARIDWTGSSSAEFSSDYRYPSSLFITNGSSCVFGGAFLTETLPPPSPDGAENVFVRTKTPQVVVVSA